MTSYECLQDLNVTLHYPIAFPRHDYWLSSLEPWWVNKRQVSFSREVPQVLFATITKDYVPEHKFQVPCDTISPTLYSGANVELPKGSCDQKSTRIELIR